jgi:hypothetical protein
METKAIPVGPGLPDVETGLLQSDGSVINRGGVHLWLAQGKADLRQMGILIHHAAGGLEQDRRPHQPVDVLEGPLVSASRRECGGLPAMSVVMADSSLVSPSWPRMVARNSETSSGAEPR